MMPQSLALGTPPSTASKRQRSTDSSGLDDRPGTSASTAGKPNAIGDGGERRARPAVRMPAYLSKNKSDISQAFQDLEWRQRFRLSHALNNPHTSPFRVDRSQTVISRNRYGNVQPWDQSRVKLKVPIGGSNYVNASPITIKSRGTAKLTGVKDDSTTSIPESKYIATQGPKEELFVHFWHMVAQEIVGDVGVIVMLTQTYEGNREKCGQYFPRDMAEPVMNLAKHEDGEEDGSNGETMLKDAGPEDDGDPFTDSEPNSRAGTDCESDAEAEPGDVQPQTALDGGNEEEVQNGASLLDDQDSVTLLEVSYDATTACEVRRLELKLGQEKKHIYHYLFGGWPDYGKPDAETKEALINLMKITREEAGNAENPRFVHCSAGVGRTGTFIAIDYLLHEMEEGRLVKMGSGAMNEAALQASGETNEDDSGKEEIATETWGKSGPVKEAPLSRMTPEPGDKSEDDLVYETVNSLREQRMMMVMNEIQFSFIYEVVRENFLERFGRRPFEGVGAVAVPVQPMSKAARVDGTGLGSSEETDAVSESEAETEIMEDEEEEDGGVQVDQSDGEQVDDDPYSAVAPESIRQGVEREM